MSPATHSFLGFKTCLIHMCLFFVLASFWLFIFMGRVVLMLEDSCNLLKLLNSKKKVSGVDLMVEQKGIKKPTLCFLWERRWCWSCPEYWAAVGMLCVPSWLLVLTTTRSCTDEGPCEEQGDEEGVRWVDSAPPVSESKKRTRHFNLKPTHTLF